MTNYLRDKYAILSVPEVILGPRPEMLIVLDGARTCRREAPEPNHDGRCPLLQRWVRQASRSPHRRRLRGPTMTSGSRRNSRGSVRRRLP